MNINHYSLENNRAGSVRSLLLLFFFIFIVSLLLAFGLYKYIKVKSAGERVYASWLILEDCIEQRAEAVDRLLEGLGSRVGGNTIKNLVAARSEFFHATEPEEKVSASEGLIMASLPVLSMAATDAASDPGGRIKNAMKDLIAIESTLSNDILSYNESVTYLKLASNGMAGDMLMIISGGRGFREFRAGAHIANGSIGFMD